MIYHIPSRPQSLPFDGRRGTTDKSTFMKEIKFDGENFTIIDGNTKVGITKFSEIELEGQYNIDSESIAALLSAYNTDIHSFVIILEDKSYIPHKKAYIHGYPVKENKKLLGEIDLLRENSDSFFELKEKVNMHNKQPFYKRIKKIEL